MFDQAAKMQILPAIFLLSAVSAVAGDVQGQRLSLMALSTLHGRQTQICKPVPAPGSCEASCGPGNIPCISFPNCYNPSVGEVCCSDGEFCEAGYYCTNAGCCRNGTPLAQCGATVSLSVIPPPAGTTSSASASTSTAKSSPSVTSQSSVTANPTASSNATLPTKPPPPFTGGAAEGHTFVLQFCITGALVAGLLMLWR